MSTSLIDKICHMCGTPVHSVHLIRLRYSEGKRGRELIKEITCHRSFSFYELHALLQEDLLREKAKLPSDTNRFFVFGTLDIPRVYFERHEKATAEAERLAMENTDHQFYVCKVLSKSTTQPVTTVFYHDPEEF